MSQLRIPVGDVLLLFHQRCYHRIQLCQRLIDECSLLHPVALNFALADPLTPSQVHQVQNTLFLFISAFYEQS